MPGGLFCYSCGPLTPTQRQENEAICTKLLGWGQHNGNWWWRESRDAPSRNMGPTVPTFTCWSSVGWILEAFADRDIEVHVLWHDAAKRWECCDWEESRFDGVGDTGPKAVRAAALEFLQR